MLTSLPQDLLNELNQLEELRSDDRQYGPRKFPRFVIRGDAELHPMEANSINRTPIEITLRDMSRNGLGFVCPQPLPVNSGWRICFLRHGYTIGEQAVLVRHCQQIRPDLYLVGGQFCIDTGLMALLGVEPGHLDEAHTPTPHGGPAGFIAPDDME